MATQTFTGTAVKDITAQIQNIAKRGKAWQEDVQKCALNIVRHVNQHHEVSLVNQLIEAIPAGARANALREWFCKHGKVEFNEEDQVFLPSRDKAKPIEAALLEKWYNCKPEPAFKAVDLDAAILQLIKRADKALKDEENADKHSIDTKKLDKLRLLMPKVVEAA